MKSPRIFEAQVVRKPLVKIVLQRDRHSQKRGVIGAAFEFFIRAAGLFHSGIARQG